MQRISTMQAACVAAAVATATGAKSDTGNPIQKAMEMLEELQQKIISQGEESQKVYDEFAEMCEDRSQQIHAEIKSSKATVEDLEADIESATDDAAAASTKIEELSSAIATDEADLKAAALLREKETGDFSVEEKELNDSIDTLQRAITILEKELQGGAAFTQVQVSRASDFTNALSAMVDSSALGLEDVQRLTSLMQTTSASEDSEEDGSELDDADEELMGAHAAATPEKKGGSIVETLEGLLEKAQTKLEDIRRAESKSKNDYEMFKQSLDSKVSYAKRDMDAAKKSAAEAGERKATSEGDLSVTKKDLAEDGRTLHELHHNCMGTAADFSAETKARSEELKALAMAKKILKETSGEGGASALQVSTGGNDDDDSGDSPSFLQLKARSRARAHAHSADGLSSNTEAATYIRKLAHEANSHALMQLASRMDMAIRSSDDPFAKVRGMITDMLGKLMKQAEADATKKAYCDKEMSHTGAKQGDKQEDIEKLTTKIDQMDAGWTKLNEEVARLQKELAEIARSQSEMDQIRSEEKVLYDKDKPVLEQGVSGIQKALKVLRDNYAKGDAAVLLQGQKSSGAAGGIIGILEVAEADLSKELSDMMSAEASAVKIYTEQTNENKLSKRVKDQDVKFKTKQAKSLDKAYAEGQSDRDAVQEELDAINEYFAKIKEQCVAKPESYEERKKRREKEIAGLKNAMEILGADAVFLQLGSLRGAVRA